MENSYKLSQSEINELLIIRSEQYNDPQFFKNDPITIPHLFKNKKDIEIIGFLVATISWGKRESIINSGKRLVEIMGDSPYEYVRDYEAGMAHGSNFVHRTFNSTDLDFFIRALQRCYKEHESLEDWFYLNPSETGIKNRIINFRNEFLKTPHEVRSEKHISNPAKGSAAKRINMFLRWMVRKDNKGVDFGIWNKIGVFELYIPLDTHTSNVARTLGILTRKQNDWKALEELMTALKNINPNDPGRFDFGLFGMGITGELNELFEIMKKAEEEAKKPKPKPAPVAQKNRLNNSRLDEIRRRLKLLKEEEQQKEN